MNLLFLYKMARHEKSPLSDFVPCDVFWEACMGYNKAYKQEV